MRILVIGGGIAGYVCALKAAKMGAEVTLAERKRIGGTCLNEGCIPTKALLEAAQIKDSLRHAKKFGINLVGKEVLIDFQTLQNRKQEVVDQLVHGIKLLLEKESIEVIESDVKLITENTVTIDEKERNFDAIVLATGSEPITLSLSGIDREGVINSTQALELSEVPKSLVIIGGGVIGTEFAFLFQSLGAEVTIVEMMDRIVPTMDPAISEMLTETLKSRGIQIYTETTVLEIGKNLTVVLQKKEQDLKLQADKVLVATGRQPVIDVLDNAKIQVARQGRFVKVDDYMRTSVKNLYAIGDVTGKNMLAHTAEEMGIRCAEHIMGKTVRPIAYEKIPSCLYTNPEAASCGLTELAALEECIPIEIGIFPLFNNSRTLIMGQQENTFVKVISAKETGELLGVHIFGPFATEMIGEVALALELECTVQEIIDTVHPHPTVSEGLKEGAASVFGQAMHSLQ